LEGHILVALFLEVLDVYNFMIVDVST
jgi:hypothetical protein